MQQTTADVTSSVSPVLTGEDVLRIQHLVRQVPVADHVVQYAIRLVRATRIREETKKPEIVENYLSWGAGPRASQYLVLAAKAKAILSGASHVMPQHIRAVALPVMRHRIITNFNAEADGISTDDIVSTLLDEIRVEGTDERTSKQMDSVMN